MTHAEAKRYLETKFICIEEHKGVYKFIDEKVLNMTIETLEKQIPKKPISKYPHRKGEYICPTCETETRCRILIYEKHCPDCGQAIDWSDVE